MENRETKFISATYIHYTKNLQKMYRYVGIEDAYKTKESLKNIIVSPKNKTNS